MAPTATNIYRQIIARDTSITVIRMNRLLLVMFIMILLHPRLSMAEVSLWPFSSSVSTLFSLSASKNTAVAKNSIERSLASGYSMEETISIQNDRICENYLKDFFNGTTDTHDKCEALVNAFKAGDCDEYIPEGDANMKPTLTTTPKKNNTTSAAAAKNTTAAAATEKNAMTEPDDKNTTFKDSFNDIVNSKLTTKIDSGIIFGTEPEESKDYAIDDTIESWGCCEIILNNYEAHCHVGEDVSDSAMLAIVGVLILCSLAKSVVHRWKLTWITDVAVCILVGAALGLLSKVFQVFENPQFDNNLFLHVLLPPIVFNAALRINKKAFKRYLAPILTYAFFGTLLASFLTGITVYGITSLGITARQIPLLESYIFGSLISSIDPVGILGILLTMGISESDMIYVLIFGESLLNDGVAILLFDILSGYLQADDKLVLDAQVVIYAGCRFLWMMLGSIGIGSLFAAAGVVFFRCFGRNMIPVVEVGTFFCWALMPYYVSDLVGCSGIVTIVATGLVMDNYVLGDDGVVARLSHVSSGEGSAKMLSDGNDIAMDTKDNIVSLEETNENDGESGHPIQTMFSGRGVLSTEAKIHATVVTEVIASLMESAIFAYLGIILFKQELHVRIGAVAIFACLISRAVMIIFVTFIIKTCTWCCFRHGTVEDDETPTTTTTSTTTTASGIDYRVQMIMFVSGMRGAVSLALVENIPLYNTVTKRGSLYKSELKTMTSATILFTVFFFGGIMDCLVRRLGIVEASAALSSKEKMVDDEENEFAGLVGRDVIEDDGDGEGVMT